MLKNRLKTLRAKTRQHEKWWKIPLTVVLVLAIFGVGVGVGQGSISFNASKNTHSKNAALPAQLDYSAVNDVYKALKANYNGKLTVSQLLDGLKEGLAESTDDPYTEYFNAKQAKTFENELNNSFSGVGAELSKDSDGNIIVIAPLKGFPAAKAGLKSQDIITSINGNSTSGMTLDEAVNKIRGKQGTKVTLGIVRDKSRTLTITITRDNIQVPSVSSKILPGNIGYMQIITFSDDTAALAQKAADKFKATHVKGIIVDLRSNPGGLVDAALSVSSLWLPSDKLVVQERGTIGTISHYSNGSDELEGIPTVVLINGGTASAAEITTAALHDNSAAHVIGEKSYGKGVVQQIVNFGDGSELKVTVASWYRPNGQNINKKGIKPDKVVQLTDADAKAGNDTQLKAAQDYLASRL